MITAHHNTTYKQQNYRRFDIFPKTTNRYNCSRYFISQMALCAKGFRINSKMVRSAISLTHPNRALGSYTINILFCTISMHSFRLFQRSAIFWRSNMHAGMDSFVRQPLRGTWQNTVQSRRSSIFASEASRKPGLFTTPLLTIQKSTNQLPHITFHHKNK